MSAGRLLDDIELADMLAVALPLLALLILAVSRGWIQAFDERLLARLFRASAGSAVGRYRRLATVARDLTALGGDTLHILILGAAMILLAAAARAAEAWLLLLVFLSARLALYGLKAIVRRDRPSLVAHRVATHTTSFPSGHAFMTTVLLLALALVLPAGAPAPVQTAALALAAALSVAIGVTRIMLGIHWPSDVIVGWLAAAAWVDGCLLLGSATGGM